MATEIDTATDHSDLFDRLLAFLQLGLTTPGGPEWEMLRYDSVNKRALFVAPGLSSLEEIHCGFSLHSNPTDDIFSIGMWMFRDYNAGLGDLEQPGISPVVYLPVWDDAMPYWFVANGQRLMIVTKVSTVYTASYIGKFLPYGTPGEYPQPYYVAAPAPGTTTRWSSGNFRDRCFFDPGAAGYCLMPGSGAWRNVWNFDQTGAGGETEVNDVNWMWPYSSGNLSGSTITNYRAMRENVDGTYPLWPLTIHGVNPDRATLGDLDGAFACTGFDNAAENTITIDGVPHLVVQDMNRTNRWNYAAIKLE